MCMLVAYAVQIANVWHGMQPRLIDQLALALTLVENHTQITTLMHGQGRQQQLCRIKSTLRALCSLFPSPAVAAAEIFGDAFHYGCVNPDTGKTEASTVDVEDEFGCGDRSCPAEFSQCKVCCKSLC